MDSSNPPPMDFSWITPDLLKVFKDRNVFKFQADYLRITTALLRKLKDINDFKLCLCYEDNIDIHILKINLEDMANSPKYS